MPGGHDGPGAEPAGRGLPGTSMVRPGLRGWQHVRMPVEWYRTPDYDQAAKAEFALRYRRARRPGRVQYKRIKAVHLLETGDPGASQWAEELLTEVTLDEDAYPFVKGGAFESLARLYRRSGQWQLAVRALEQCISITGPAMSGTSGLPDLTLAEILLDNDPARLPTVADLLSSPALISRIRFNSELFRYFVVTARTCQRLGQDPGPPALRALDLLENDQPRLPRNPAVGRIHASGQTVRELRELTRHQAT